MSAGRNHRPVAGRDSGLFTAVIPLPSCSGTNWYHSKHAFLCSIIFGLGEVSFLPLAGLKSQGTLSPLLSAPSWGRFPEACGPHALPAQLRPDPL